MKCHVLITHHNGEYRAWCKPCNWESEPHDFKWQAEIAGRKHSGQEEEHHPPWKRGPR